MKKKTPNHETTSSRREILKKAGAASVFVVPTIVSFKISDLAVASSGSPCPPPPGKLSPKG